MKKVSQRRASKLDKELSELSDASSLALYLQEGIRLRKSGNIEQSIKYLTTVSSDRQGQSDLPIIRYHLAMSHFTAGNCDISCDILTSVIEKGTKDWRIYRLRGECLLKLSKTPFLKGNSLIANRPIAAIAVARGCFLSNFLKTVLKCHQIVTVF